VLPVRLDHGILLVPGALNGQPVQLVVDTGAEGSLVSSEAVARFGLERDTTRRTTINSVGGQITMANAWVRSFIVGNLETPQVSLAVGPLPALGEPASPLAGLVGADYLAAFDIEFDLPRQRIGVVSPG
jgi:predicted aspartyl protease